MFCGLDLFWSFFWNRTAFCFIFNVNACGNSNEMKLKLKLKFKQASICIHQLSVCCNAYTRFFLSKISNACWTIHHTNVGESIKLVLFKLNQAVNNVSSFPWTNQVIFNFTWLPKQENPSSKINERQLTSKHFALVGFWDGNDDEEYEKNVYQKLLAEPWNVEVLAFRLVITRY